MRSVSLDRLLLLTGALALALLAACGRPDPLRFHVTFEEVDGIEPGARVLHRGLVVGEVTDVGLDARGLVLVTVEIDDEYRTAVARNSIIRVDAVGLRRRRQLVIEDGEGRRLPVEQDDVIAGSEGVVDDTVTELKQAALQAWESAGEIAGDLAEKLRGWTESDEAKELVESLEKLSRETAEKSRDGLRRLREEELPRLREQAEQVRRRLAERKGEEEADRFWSRFERELEKLRRAADGTTEEDLPPERPPQAPENGADGRR